jgi:hypothetical protein
VYEGKSSLLRSELSKKLRWAIENPKTTPSTGDLLQKIKELEKEVLLLDEISKPRTDDN